MCFHKVRTPRSRNKTLPILLETSLVSLWSSPHSSSSPKVSALQTSRTVCLFFTTFDPYRNGRNHTIHTHLCLASFTQCYLCEIPSFWCREGYVFCSHFCVAARHVSTWQLIYPFSWWWAVGATFAWKFWIKLLQTIVPFGAHSNTSVGRIPTSCKEMARTNGGFRKFC